MKTLKTNSIRIVALMITLLSIVSCNSKSNNTKPQKQLSTIEQSAEAPSVDIHSASFMGNLKAINQHILAGTNLNTKDQYGSTPLIIAITFGKTEIAERLIEAGADLNVTNNDGSTPLHIASFFCRTEIVETLLKNEADKTIKNNYGSTPLNGVSGAFSTVKPIYEQLNKDMGPLGLKLDYDYLEETRPIIAEMLK